MSSNRRTASHVRRWGTGVGVAGGAVVAAAMIGAAPTARADTSTVGDVLSQATADLSQYDFSQLFNPDNPSLTGAFEVIDQGFFTAGQTFTQGFDADIVPAADQTNPLLLDAANELLNADQALLNSGATTPVELAANDMLVQDAANNMSNVIFAELFAAGAANAEPGAASTADTASVLDMATASVTTTGTSPADLLSEASTDLTDANQVLGQMDVSGVPDQPALGVFVDTAITQQNVALQQLGTLASAESTISSYDNGALSSLVAPLFTDIDQQWYQTSEAVLTADQALEAAVTSGSGLDAAQFGALIPDLQLLGDAFNAIPIDWASSLF